MARNCGVRGLRERTSSLGMTVDQGACCGRGADNASAPEGGADPADSVAVGCWRWM